MVYNIMYSLRLIDVHRQQADHVIVIHNVPYFVRKPLVFVIELIIDRVIGVLLQLLLFVKFVKIDIVDFAISFVVGLYMLFVPGVNIVLAILLFGVPFLDLFVVD